MAADGADAAPVTLLGQKGWPPSDFGFLRGVRLLPSSASGLSWRDRELTDGAAQPENSTCGSGGVSLGSGNGLDTARGTDRCGSRRSLHDVSQLGGRSAQGQSLPVVGKHFAF